jgi:hypothetical protein
LAKQKLNYYEFQALDWRKSENNLSDNLPPEELILLRFKSLNPRINIMIIGYYPEITKDELDRLKVISNEFGDDYILFAINKATSTTYIPTDEDLPSGSCPDCSLEQAAKGYSSINCGKSHWHHCDKHMNAWYTGCGNWTGQPKDYTEVGMAKT